MSKPSRHVLVDPPHPLLRVVSLGFITFIFTLFTLELSRFGTSLAHLWFATAIMMVALYRHAERLWPAILLACSLGSMGASWLYLSAAELNFSWLLINVIEALAGAALLRKWLPLYNPLQNLNDWIRLAVGGAIIPPLLGGALLYLLTPEHASLKAFMTWVLSESIGTLMLVPPGLLVKARYLRRHRNPRLFSETLFALILTVVLSWLAMLYFPWPFTCIIVLLMWSAVRLPRLEAFLVCMATVMVVSLMLAFDPTLVATPKRYVLVDFPWLPFLMIMVPVHIMTMVTYAFRTEQKNITESEARFRNAMEYSAIGMALVGTDGQWLQVNKALCQFLGYRNDELCALTFQQLTWPEDLHNDLDQMTRLIRGDINSYSMEKRYYTRNGEVVWALLAVSLVRYKDQTPLYFIAQIEDINDLKQSEWTNKQLMARITLTNEALYQEKERLHITLDSIGEAVICIDADMNVTFMNPVAEKMSGWQQESATGAPLLTVLRITSGANGPPIENIYSADMSRSVIEQDVVLHCRNGGSYDIHYRITPLSTLDGGNIGSVLVIQDVTESRKVLRQLSYNASHDALTHLANRASFENQLQRLLHRIHDTHQQHALVFIDLDRFKAVNDTAGHAAGDALLCELASLMLTLLRADDILARLGGDEFGLLLPDCTLERARFIALRLINAINDYHFVWNERAYSVGASAGITLIDEHNNQAAEVMSQADIACYASKNSGRARVTVYQPQQEQANRERGIMSPDELWHVIKDNPLLLIVRGVASPRVPQARSFWLTSLRLWSGDGEAIDEQALRPALTDPALCEALDRRVLLEFFQHYASMAASKGFCIALPLSAAGLCSATLIKELLEQLARNPVYGRLLHLMIPAEVLTRHPDEALSIIQQLRQAGCRIILTQPGRELELFDRLTPGIADYLLLDSDLSTGMHGNLLDEILVSIIQGHAQRLGIKTIAGPVQMPLMMDALSGIGIDMIYGDVIAAAQPLDQLLHSSYFAIN
ncbi:TPA: diguanylate cyclase [Citrobacter freundii]